MPNDNMKLWDAVCETNPADTKHVNQRGGFTAIGAQSQIREATGQWGPVGAGWGYQVDYHELVGKAAVFQFADVTLWYWPDGAPYDTGKQARFGPVRGCCLLVNDKGRLDEDAPKKALTDGLTKALSHLGFNADVFLGKFDDCKYVDKMKAKFGNQQGDAPTEPERDWTDEQTAADF